MHLVVLSDTHLRSADLGPLGPRLRDKVAGADAVLHAGDIVTEEALAGLRELARPRPLHAVRGNNDGGLATALPESLVIELGGAEVAIVHDAGPHLGREARLRRRFPTAALVVFGHSHQALDKVGLDGQVLFNPGSTLGRFGSRKTFGWVEIEGGRVVRREIVEV